METGSKTAIKVLVFVGIVAALSIAFTVDDFTGVGEMLDPVEFAAMALTGLGFPFASGMFKRR